MKKILLVLLCVIAFGIWVWPDDAYAIDGYSIIVLARDATPDGDTIVYCLVDPDGSPLNRKCRLEDLILAMSHLNIQDRGTYIHSQLDTHVDTDHLLQSELLDEDYMTSASATKPPSQQSVKFYVEYQDHTDHGDGTNCAADEYPIGVDENGNVQGCINLESAVITIVTDTADTLIEAHSLNDPDAHATHSDDSDAHHEYPDATGFAITCTTGQILGTDCGSTLDLTMGFIVHIASGTVILPAVATGIFGCVKATTAAAVYVDPNASDRFRLDMVSLADGDKLQSDASIDSTICFYADSTAGWTTLFNPAGFIDGN